MTHTNLIERLEKARGADDDLSVDVLRALGERPSFGHVTNSIDAALALVERVLPGWIWEIGSLVDGGHDVTLIMWERRPADRNHIFATHKSPAIAILTALLKAVEGRD